MTESLVSGGISQQLLFSSQSPCSVPLEIAAARGHTGTVKKLLDCGGCFVWACAWGVEIKAEGGMR